MTLSSVTNLKFKDMLLFFIFFFLILKTLGLRLGFCMTFKTGAAIFEETVLLSVSSTIFTFYAMLLNNLLKFQPCLRYRLLSCPFG